MSHGRDASHAAGSRAERSPATLAVYLLCGGLGTRLRAVTDLPKALVEVAGWPFLRYHLAQVARLAPDRIVFLTGHAGDRIESAFGPADARRLFVREASPLGTGGALAHARSHAAERNWVANGDSFVDVDPRAVVADWKPGTALMVAVNAVDRSEYGGIEIDADGRVAAFVEKGTAGEGWINSGVYVLGRDLLNELPEGVSQLERDHLPRWAREGRLRAHCAATAFFRDIGTPERLAQAQREFVPVRERLEVR